MSVNVISRGEVYYVKSIMPDTVGSEQKAGRPAVIVSNNSNNEHSTTVEICYLTLKDKPPLPTHVFIDKGTCINSTVLCEQVTTVSTTRLGDYMCRLSDSVMDKVDRALAISLGIDYLFYIKNNTDAVEPAVDTSSGDQIKALKSENSSLRDMVDSLEKKVEELKLNAKESAMYEKMYNDIVNKLVGR